MATLTKGDADITDEAGDSVMAFPDGDTCLASVSIDGQDWPEFTCDPVPQLRCVHGPGIDFVPLSGCRNRLTDDRHDPETHEMNPADGVAAGMFPGAGAVGHGTDDQPYFTAATEAGSSA
ncbi:hypothetical protein [Primorskyibacter sp. 2E107]|uniref:hypothetical protein n=1 Tax=Primorskyibacter sp. 2E107 TaxID=3403458 RepID=UPI003AF5BF77